MKASMRALHAEADTLEPKAARAFRRSVERIRAGVSINDLAMRLAAKDGRRALALVTGKAVKDALAPMATVITTAVLRGGRVGAETLNKAVKA